MKTNTFGAALAAAMWVASVASAQVSVTTVLQSGLAEPYGVAVDGENHLYISDSANNRIVRLDGATGVASRIAGSPETEPGSEDGWPWEARFSNPQGVALATVGGAFGLLVADNGNHTIRFVELATGYVRTLAGQAGLEGGNADGGPGVSQLRSPYGLASDGTNFLYIADMGNNAVRILDLATANLSTLSVNTTFGKPQALVLGESNQLWVADTLRNKVKLIHLTTPTSGTLVSELGSGTAGATDALSGANARFNLPAGLLWWPDTATLLISDTGNHTIRLATNNPTYGADNYSVQTLAGVPGMSGFADGTALGQALLNNPAGLALDLEGGFAIADVKNNAIRRIQNGPVRPPVSAPRIGWVDFVWTETRGYITALRTADQPRTFNNEVYFAILRETGTDCHYTTAPRPWPPGFVNVGENPSKAVGATPPDYRDALEKYLFELDLPVIEVERNDLGGFVIKAIGFQSGRQNSPIAQASYAFQAGTPSITGFNLASFRVSCITTNPPATIYYTVDGTEPTKESAVVPPGGQLQLMLPEELTNVVFKARAYAPKYLPSEIAEKVFYRTNYIPTRMTLGFPAGEASSTFVGSPGQTFYTPITLQLAEEATMYSLQFNLTITNLVGPPARGQLDFASMLYEATSVAKGDKGPPNQGSWFRSIPPAMWATNGPANRLIIRPSDPTIPLLDLTFYNTDLGLIGVGWIERWLFKDLYDTTKQDLISYSIAHDTLFEKADGQVVLGAGAFTVPSTATNGCLYQLTLGRPSATSDGVGAPGSQVFIATPISGFLTNGGHHAQRVVTMGQEKYVVGDVSPFRWLNAGDFGDSNLLNDDVLQVFSSAIYNLSPTNPLTGAPSDPPYYSDFRDAIDAGPVLGVLGADGYYHPAFPVFNQMALFDGDDKTVNSIAFGDGNLDVTDVYITFRRSLDPSLTWWRRFYSGGTRVAEPVANTYPTPASPAPASNGSDSRARKSGDPVPTEPPAIQFSAGDIQTTGGQTVQIPIRANIRGNYPLRVLMLGLTVQPLGDSPPLTENVQFTPVGALGLATLTSAPRPGSYTAAWLNSQIAGLSGDALLGTLTIKVPANASATAAYAVHFSHVSASPNGLASFPQQVQPGLVTLADRSASSLNDGIADAWRLRYFGSVHAILAAADADADGDGHANRAEHRTGTHPNDSQSVLRLLSKRAADAATALVVRWPSVQGKQYVIERAAALYGAAWVPVATLTGSGWDMEFSDPDLSAAPRFYRVRMAE